VQVIGDQPQRLTSHRTSSLGFVFATRANREIENSAKTRDLEKNASSGA